MRLRPGLLAILSLPGLVSGCMVGPDYSRPSVETPLTFKEGGTREDSAAYVASRKGWRPAAPNDGAERGDWWRVFRDPTLDRLIRLVDVDGEWTCPVAGATRHLAVHDAVNQSRLSLVPFADRRGLSTVHQPTR